MNERWRALCFSNRPYRKYKCASADCWMRCIVGYIWIKFGHQLHHNAPNSELYACAPVFANGATCIGLILQQVAPHLAGVCLTYEGFDAPLGVGYLSASHQRHPGLIPGQGHIFMWVELCVGSLLCLKGLPDHSILLSRKKIKHFRSLVVLRCRNGLMWLAAKCALACQLLEHVLAVSFAIQLSCEYYD